MEIWLLPSFTINDSWCQKTIGQRAMADTRDIGEIDEHYEQWKRFISQVSVTQKH